MSAHRKSHDGGKRQSSQSAERNRLAEQEGLTANPEHTAPHAFEQTVEHQPLAAVLTAFGIGFGFGALIGAMMAPPPQHRQRHIAETLGRKFLDSMEGWVPQNLKR